MPKPLTIFTDFGWVSCGKEAVKTIELKNETNITQELVVREKTTSDNENRFRIHPLKAVVEPNRSARFILTYLSNEEDVTNNFCYDVWDSSKLVAKLAVRAQSAGPFLNPTILNVKFFRFRDVNQISKNVELENKAQCGAKFCFDLDEENQVFEISQRSGTINARQKLGLKVTFNPPEPGVYYKKIFCIVQYHPPVILNVLGIYLPKIKVEPKDLTLMYPPEFCYPSGYEEYMAKVETEYLWEEEKILFFQNRLKDYKTPGGDSVETESKSSDRPTDQPQSNIKVWSDIPTSQVFLTTRYIDMKNFPEVAKATALVNVSKCQVYYYEWTQDPKRHFQIDPWKGLIEANSKVYFSVYFTPSILDYLFHAELDLRVFPCYYKDDPTCVQTVYLPFSESLRIIGHSFPNDSCGWVAQCRVTPKSLHLRSCVPDEKVFGTFMIERQGHLPFNFAVVPPKDSNFIIQPSLGYLSGDFQLFVVYFVNDLKEPGFYSEDFKIKFNNSELSMETVRISVCVEKPMLILGENDSLVFTPIFPGSKIMTKIPIKNPTNLHISYEFQVQEDITWTEVLNPTGIIEPKSFGEVDFIFKPDSPREYLEHISCWVSSTSKMDYIEIISLQVMGSCQSGYLVATPSIHDFGESSYKDEKCIKITLFNFSPLLIFFHLTPRGAFGDAQRDVKIYPERGWVSPKGSIKVLITIIPHEIDAFTYEVTCQNSVDDSEDAEPCEEPRPIFSLKFEGVLPTFQIIDLSTENGGPLLSPHWLWKMFSVDKLNEALSSVNPKNPIRFTLPELAIKSLPMTVFVLLEASKHGEIAWDFSLDVTCRCNEKNFHQPVECFHCSSVIIDPMKAKLLPKEKLIARFNVKDHLEKCEVDMNINLPHGRTVSLVSVPHEDPVIPSFYINSPFYLKPVFLGDPQPLLQLFWIYNSDDQPVSYTVNDVALQHATTVQGVFRCINPTGVLPPISSTPIGFVFRPYEITSYSLEVPLTFHNKRFKTIRLIGEGALNRNPLREMAIEKTIPRIPKLLRKEVALTCCECVIDIHFLRVFSQTKRCFYLVNNSETSHWGFRWHSFKSENIFAAKVEPAKGIVEPNEKKLMTLILQSYSYPTSLSFSIPCDVSNYSGLKVYEQSVRVHNLLAEKCKDYFTITEKGITQGAPDYPIAEKPKMHHIFLTVNANVVSNVNAEQNLTHSQERALRAVNSMSIGTISNSLKPSMQSFIVVLLEKLLWNVGGTRRIEDTLRNLKKFQDYTYLQILPDVRRKRKNLSECFREVPDKNYIQRFLESRLKEVVCQKLNSEEDDF